MKLRIITVIAVLALAFAGFAPKTALAGAYDTAFTTSITYQNVGDADTTMLDLYFFASPDDTTPIMVSLDPLAAGAGASLFIGSLGDIDDGFQGAAYIQSDQPILATLVQLPQGSATVKNRALSNGFSFGAPQALIATVLKNTFDATTKFSVQNAGSADTTVEITFYDTSAAEVHSMTQDIAPGAAFYADAGAIGALPSGFNGSAVVTAGAEGLIVAGVMELDNVGIGLKAFEGVAAGGSLFYMPSALCAVFGGQNTAYAVQNTSLVNDAEVSVTYLDNNGDTFTDGPYTVGPGAKKSFIACDVMADNTFGSGVVNSTGADIIAIGKAFGAGLTTAFNGVDVGYEKLALPYVRWATDANYAAGLGQRVFIAIQNIGADIPAGSAITVEYVDRDGVVLGTHTFDDGLASQAKFNSNASSAGLTEFGYYYSPVAFGGSVIITGPAGSELAAIARVSTQVSPGAFVSEDYNGMAVP